jgi:hypothetical protein
MAGILEAAAAAGNEALRAKVAFWALRAEMKRALVDFLTQMPRWFRRDAQKTSMAREFGQVAPLRQCRHYRFEFAPER